MCHGYDGVPILPGAPNFSIGERITEKKDAELLQSISQGKGTMPPWEGILSEQEQMSVLRYSRHIAGDVVYRDYCESCHETSVPPFSAKVPSGADLLGYEGELEICRACEIENDMSGEEIISVIDLLRSLQKK